MSDEYPEHDKLKAIQPQSQAICEFIEWLEGGEAGKDGERLEIAHRDGDWLEPYYEKKEPLVARFFDIDLEKLLKEKDQMLEKCMKKLDKIS